MRARLAILVALAGLPLGGCVAGLAVGAVGAVGSAVAKGGAPAADPNIDVGPAALAACTARAAQQGEVHVIDVEHRGPGKAIVWGTVGEGPQRRSFECRYAGKILGFTVRAIGPAR
ncbi:MAG TPA: hypothetical protein VGD66_09110 [Allosphingosinicella sp.]|jgi:hypothetical protein